MVCTLKYELRYRGNRFYYITIRFDSLNKHVFLLPQVCNDSSMNNFTIVYFALSPYFDTDGIHNLRTAQLIFKYVYYYNGVKNNRIMAKE